MKLKKFLQLRSSVFLITEGSQNLPQGGSKAPKEKLSAALQNNESKHRQTKSKERVCIKLTSKKYIIKSWTGFFQTLCIQKRTIDTSLFTYHITQKQQPPSSGRYCICHSVKAAPKQLEKHNKEPKVLNLASKHPWDIPE